MLLAVLAFTIFGRPLRPIIQYNNSVLIFCVRVIKV